MCIVKMLLEKVPQLKIGTGCLVKNLFSGLKNREKKNLLYLVWQYSIGVTSIVLRYDFKYYELSISLIVINETYAIY